MREIILDTETTGFDAKNGDRLVEIGCIELLNCIPTGREWHRYINPERDVPPGAFEVHGLSTEFLADKPLFAEVADDFLDFIEGGQLVIHNAPFDVGFLNAELENIERRLIAWEQVIDTLALARRRHPGSPCSLDALCKRYSIDLSARDKHGALLDCRLLASVYVELTGGHQARLELGARSGQVIAFDSAGGGGAMARPAPLAPRITEEELAAHERFLEGLGAPALWSGGPAKGEA
ncbi:DNA polymerase III subunit epsilon [Methyloligella sp. 2.7D]|uniref:DNA polymerase III subunit epsilon n=1 Tax=unclassified Methyloligella TaxID=2625955 RepID=UPI00157DE8C3|nr:DNA polymerase III subunit epsilon [Methyloligella sp. GL2]QKP76279.1 DNA polymerase III subunit epsilon [Methyloligella sp. GL2]